MRSNILNVFVKELKMFARDAKTLFTTILTPLLLIPVVLLITTSSTQALQESELRVAFSHSDNIVSTYISLIDNVRVVKTDDIEKDLQSGRISAYIDIPENANELFLGDEQLPINVTYNESLTESQIAIMLIDEALSTLEVEPLRRKLTENNIPLEYLNKIDLSFTAQKEKNNSSIILSIFPMMLITYCVFGISAISNDIGAGEKEKGTFEPLLTTSANRNDIILGKFFAIGFIGMICALSSVLGMYGFAAFSSTQSFSIDAVEFMMLLLVAIVTTMLFSCICFSLSVYSKSNKEAQTYTSIVTIASMLPTMSMMSGGVGNLQWMDFLCPVINATNCIKEIIQHSYRIEHILITCVSTLICSVLLFFVIRKMFKNEKILYRT